MQEPRVRPGMSYQKKEKIIKLRIYFNEPKLGQTPRTLMRTWLYKLLLCPQERYEQTISQTDGYRVSEGGKKVTRGQRDEKTWQQAIEHSIESLKYLLRLIKL